MSAGYYVFIGLMAALCLFAYLKSLKLLCRYCRGYCTPYNKLPLTLQSQIRDYFMRCEMREAKYSQMFVCESCKVVSDDFSGEYKSRDIGVAGISVGFGERTFCKVCGQLMSNCQLSSDYIRCPDCKTEYEWVVYGEAGLQFLKPKSFEILLSRPRNDHGMG